MNDYLLILLAVLATSGRVLGLVLLSIVTGWFLAYGAIKGRIFEIIYLSIIEVFESVPVISFFPIVLIIFVDRIGGALGVELAADFLVFTAVVWNIWMAEYQSFKTIPREMLEVAENYRLGLLARMRNVYIPFSLPRIAANIFPSVSDGFFYITLSEVFAVGTRYYTAFGVGSVLDRFAEEGDSSGIYATVLILGAVIVAIIAMLRRYSAYVVSKYTLDTDVPVMRRGRFSLRQTSRALSAVARNPFARLAGYYRRAPRRGYFEKRERGMDVWRYVIASAGLLVLSLIIYASYIVVVGVPGSTWLQLLSETPLMLLYLLVDYARVAVIVAIVFVFSILLGYYFAMHYRSETVGVPLLQTLSAYPAPIYFPFIFVAAEPGLQKIMGGYTSDVFVVLLGFISTFYYLFYSFWMGIKAMPAEYFDLMRNMKMGFFRKLRSVILPSTFPYLISGITSTVNSIWGGLIIGEYWPGIYGHSTLQVQTGLMKFIDISTADGKITLAAWASVLFGVVIIIYSLLFTRKMMNLAKSRYVAEEGIFAA